MEHPFCFPPRSGLAPRYHTFPRCYWSTLRLSTPCPPPSGSPSPQLHPPACFLPQEYAVAHNPRPLGTKRKQVTKPSNLPSVHRRFPAFPPKSMILFFFRKTPPLFANVSKHVKLLLRALLPVSPASLPTHRSKDLFQDIRPPQ